MRSEESRWWVVRSARYGRIALSFVCAALLGAGFLGCPPNNDDDDDDDDTTAVDDLIFIHHSVGSNWLNDGLEDALLAKDYIDERNDITYGTDLDPDDGRTDSLADTPGDETDMYQWLYWFNDYLGGVKGFDCEDGENRIVIFKSCYPNSDIVSDGTDPGDPFSATKSIANYKAIFRHPLGAGWSYTRNGKTYWALQEVFEANPDTLFIAVTSPPRHYGPEDGTSDAAAHRARVFNNWLKDTWLPAYKTRTGLNNVAVFDLFDVLAYADDNASHPNRLKQQYGGNSGDSHPNAAGNQAATEVFATDGDNFLDAAWEAFNP